MENQNGRIAKTMNTFIPNIGLFVYEFQTAAHSIQTKI